MSGYRNEGHDDWLDAIATGEGHYLACPEGHGSLPPREVCPDCGATDLVEEPLPGEGIVETFTVTHVASPNFDDDAPYATAIAEFGDVSLTGHVRGDDAEALDTGTVVTVDVEESATTGERLVVFRPQ